MKTVQQVFDAVGSFTAALQKATLGPVHPGTPRSKHNLAISSYVLGRHAEALEFREEALALQKAKLGPDHPDTLTSMVHLASSYSAFGRHAEALALREEIFAHKKAKLGPDHPHTLTSKMNVAVSYGALCRSGEALELLEETLTFQKVKLGPNHPDTLISLYNIACVHALMILNCEDREKQAELAMAWLEQAVEAGYKDVSNIKQDKDLDVLRDRDDFKELMSKLGTKP